MVNVEQDWEVEIELGSILTQNEFISGSGVIRRWCSNSVTRYLAAAQGQA